MDSYVNRTALVTGAASGIAAALATELRSRGAVVTTTDVEGDVDRRLDVRDLAGPSTPWSALHWACAQKRPSTG